MDFSQARRKRRPSLTPMIDVVFLLLVFFMLAARFGVDTQVTLNLAGTGGADWNGPPRLVDIAADGLRLNGTPVSADTLPDALSALMNSPADTVVLRAGDDVPLQQLITLMDALQTAGLTALVLVD
ncbi:biopolymer transporter ExbD [Thalassovita sp.]|uniref:ExbD/TolR family protein n=1 Tax=Thalassovita sp. TaxID=1979401 RepID=UPI0029DE797B|nr:biopolymer transporter ExbD [Thalassovita sp.]